MCGVSPQTVATIKGEVSNLDTSTTVTGRDGKRYSSYSPGGVSVSTRETLPGAPLCTRRRRAEEHEDPPKQRGIWSALCIAGHSNARPCPSSMPLRVPCSPHSADFAERFPG